ncbi:MAG: hypothetical protein IPQ07_05905 [Myxococcales bacterium]|nr:hypothetical protein [Myxococcales bacterium]
MRLLSVVMAGLLVGTGCAANSYTIPHSELQRLSTLPPEQRSERVLVSQEITGSEVENAQPVTGDTEIIFIPQINIGGGYSGGARGGGGTGGRGGGLGGMKLSGGGSDGKAAAVAVIVLAAVALVAVAAVEGSRFDGWVRLHPMHPVHLIGRDGSQAVMPLAWIDPQAAAWTEKAVVRPTEGPWLQLDRKPLTRGGTYGLYGGYGSSRSVYGDVGAGPSFVIQGGYFPEQHIGILANIAFAWRDNQYQGTLFDSRYMLELQALPVVVGPLHAGLYVGGGLAYRWEDTPQGTITNGGKGNDGSTAYAGGAMFQLELHTRIALTARIGRVKAHGDQVTDMLLGISVY